MRVCFLAIDASTYVGSAALVTEGGTIHGETDVPMRGAHEERLMPAIAALLEEARPALRPTDLAAVICGAGPGSFTSLRIAAAIAKGIASGAKIPLFAVSSLLLIPAGARPAVRVGNYLALLDAMRGDFYTLRCNVGSDGTIRADGDTKLVSGLSLDSADDGRGPRVVQIGAGRTIDAAPHARGVARLIRAITAGAAVDVSSWEPDYGRLAEAEVRLAAAQLTAAAPVAGLAE